MDKLYNNLKKIKMFLTDVDGVLTNGKIILDNNGNEIKFFDVKDGHGIKMLHRYGITVGFVTGRESKVVLNRAKELGVNIIYQKVRIKLDVVEKILKEYNLSYSEIAYCGDDIVDIPVLRRAGVAFTVNNAVNECKNIADYITVRNGGSGAVREITDLILKAKGFWEEVKARYEIVD
jgi:3-deoxy-D-manno-octulosonate 8-phosphate phosphatase (KDO 8-P phosphatase)